MSPQQMWNHTAEQMLANTIIEITVKLTVFKCGSNLTFIPATVAEPLYSVAYFLKKYTKRSSYYVAQISPSK